MRSYEYFGHDAVVRVQPDDGGLPELVVRITGGVPLAPGTRVGVRVQGAVVVWPEPAGWGSPRSRKLFEPRLRNYLVVVLAELPWGTEAGAQEVRWLTCRQPDVGGFHGPQVCDLVGISYRQLDYWARTGLLQPSVAAARGSGTRRVYSYSDVLELKVIKQLLDAGVSLQSARRAVECLREDLGADVASSNLVLTGTSSVLARSNGEVVDLLAGGQGVFNIVPLAGVVDELEADIVRLDIAAQSRPSGERTGHDRRSGGPGRRRVSQAASARRRRRVRAIRRARRPARFASPILPSGSSPPCSTSTRSAGSTSRSSSPCAGTSQGSPVSGFRPDFWLPERGVFIELTTAEQRLVTRKNGKVRRMRELYPEIPVLVVYQRDFLALLEAPRPGRDRSLRRLIWRGGSRRQRERRRTRIVTRPSCGARRPRGQDGAVRWVGDAAGLPVGHRGRAPGLPGGRGGLRREPSRHRAGRRGRRRSTTCSTP